MPVAKDPATKVLLMEVQSYPTLYPPGDPEYLNTTKKDVALEKILE